MAADRDASGRYLPGHSVPGPGRGPIYDQSMNEQATKLALLGMTDEEMARFFGITTKTFYEWKSKYIAFCEAVNEGKEIADAEVAYSLYKKAVGITYQVERLRKNEEGVTEIVKLNIYEPPDTGAMKLWLTNRRRRDWSESARPERTVNLNITDPMDLTDEQLLTIAAGGGEAPPSAEGGEE